MDKLQFIVDESVDKTIVDRLKENYDVIYIDGPLKGSDDDMILRLTEEQNRILITADKDFGEMVFLSNRLHAGIILCRLHGLSPEHKALLVVSLIKKYSTELLHSFTVIQPENIRIRKKNRHE
jgi:predicted nuclease of predicted toxin-antitoxin system